MCLEWRGDAAPRIQGNRTTTSPRELSPFSSVVPFWRRTAMDFGKGALLWLLGVPLPIILLLALFWHH
jgi:hypothetical protein